MLNVQASMLITASPRRVHLALTDANQLKMWCCEEPTVTEDTYWLRGKTVPFGALGGAIHERSESLLTFMWMLDGASTRVQIRLEPVEQQDMPPATFSRVVVEHTGIPEGALQSKWPKEAWEAVWSLFLRNLKGWVERAAQGGQYDYTSPTPPIVERSLVVDAPSDRVWQAIVDPEQRRRWLTEELGEELDREEGRWVTYRFMNETEVTWTVTPAGPQQTLVTVKETAVAYETLDNHLGWHDFLVALGQAVQLPIIRLTEWIAASPMKVWRYLSTKEGLSHWWSGMVTFEPQVGGLVEHNEYGSMLRGRVVHFEPGRRLSFTWTEDGVPWPQPLLLTIELMAEGEGTRVTLTQSGFEALPPHEYAGYQRGWSDTTMLGELKLLSEAAS